jgi:hypothetical protein
MEKATADGWKLSDDCRSVAKEDEMISVQADEALRRYVPCGPEKVATYAKHGNCWDQPYNIRPKYQKLNLNTEGCRLIIAAHCHSLEGRMTAAPGLDVDSAYELCQKYKLPVVGFRHEFNNFADSPELPRIMCTQKWGEITVPVDDWDVYAYVPSKDGRINKVKVEHPQRLFPKLNLIDATERLAKDGIPMEKVTVKPRSGLAPTPPRPADCSSGGSTIKPEFDTRLKRVLKAGDRFGAIAGGATDVIFAAVDGLNGYAMAERNGASCPISEGVVGALVSAGCPLSNFGANQESYYMAQETCNDGSHMMEYDPSRRAYRCKKDWERFKRGEYYVKTNSGWEEEAETLDQFLPWVSRACRTFSITGY